MEKLTLLTLVYDDYVDILDLFMTQLFGATINQ